MQQERIVVDEEIESSQKLEASEPSNPKIKCRKCHERGHISVNCPAQKDVSSEPAAKQTFRRPTGIPRSELVEVPKDTPGVYLTYDGKFVLPFLDAQAMGLLPSPKTSAGKKNPGKSAVSETSGQTTENNPSSVQSANVPPAPLLPDLTQPPPWALVQALLSPLWVEALNSVSVLQSSPNILPQFSTMTQPMHTDPPDDHDVRVERFLAACQSGTPRTVSPVLRYSPLKSNACWQTAEDAIEVGRRKRELRTHSRTHRSSSRSPISNGYHSRHHHSTDRRRNHEYRRCSPRVRSHRNSFSSRQYD